jgi:hypothetical protein
MSNLLKLVLLVQESSLLLLRVLTMVYNTQKLHCWHFQEITGRRGTNSKFGFCRKRALLVGQISVLIMRVLKLHVVYNTEIAGVLKFVRRSEF